LVLATVSGVRDVAVTSTPDERWGERLIALVVSDDRDLSTALADAALQQIGPWAKPKEIRYVTEIPRTDNGKVRRDVLADTEGRCAT
jgi:acyl-coenzyme A synthetase/AMP-(fatty) acid ligase